MLQMSKKDNELFNCSTGQDFYPFKKFNWLNVNLNVKKYYKQVSNIQEIYTSFSTLDQS